MVIEICLSGAERWDLIIRLDERRVLQMGIFINLLREGKLSLIGGINMFSIWRRDRPQTDVRLRQGSVTSCGSRHPDGNLFY